MLSEMGLVNLLDYPQPTSITDGGGGGGGSKRERERERGKQMERECANFSLGVETTPSTHILLHT